VLRHAGRRQRREWEQMHPGMTWDAWVRFQRGPDRS
jgi:hypothetical protein